MRHCLTFVSTFLLSTTVAFAQSTGPQVAAAVRHDVSPPLRNMTPAARSFGVLEGPAVRHLPFDRNPSLPFDGALQPPGLASPTIPATLQNFDGIGQGFLGPAGTFTVNSAPPDPNSTVGLNHILQIVNTDIAVLNKSGTPIFGPVPTNTVWSGFGGGCQTANDGDGTVSYDKVADRFVIAQFQVTTTPYQYCVAVSATSDPTGSYNRYAFTYTDGFPDYPKMSVWPDAYYTTFNMFNTAGTAYLYAKVCALDRTKMLAGQAATQQCFNTSNSYGGLLASDIDGTRPPPAGAPNTVLALGTISTSLAYWKFHVDWATPANSTFVGPGTLTVPSYTEACGISGTCIPQSGGGSLDSLSDRLMYRLAYRNFADGHQSLLANHSVAAGTSVGVRWYELRLDAAGTPSVFQAGTYAPDASYRWMGSIAMDQAGNIGLGYSTSSSSLKPSIRYTGRLAGDAAGAMTQGESIIITGAGAQGSSLSRWGDYTSMVVDPVDDCTFWYTNQYIPANGTFNWRTRIGSFKFSSCGTVVSNDFSVSASPTSVSITQNASGTSTISTALASGVAETVALSLTGLPAGAAGSFSPTSVTTGGSSTLTLSSGTAAPGTYPLTVTATAPSATHTTAVSLVVTAAPDFSVGIAPSSRTVTAGTSTTYTVSTTSLNGSTQSIALSVAGLPAGASGSFSPATVTAGSSSTLTVTTTTAAALTTFTVTGASGVTSHSTTASLTVTAPPDFTVGISPAARTVAAGASTTYTVSTAAVNGSTQSIALSVAGLPAGASGSFVPATVTAGGSSTLTVTTTIAASLTTFTVTGTSGATSHSATASLTVTAGSDFTTAVSPASLTVVAGASGTYAVSTTALNGSTQSIVFSIGGLPPNVTATFSPATVTAGGSSTLTVVTSKRTAASTATITVTGTAGPVSHAVNATLVISKGKR